MLAGVGSKMREGAEKIIKPIGKATAVTTESSMGLLGKGRDIILEGGRQSIIKSLDGLAKEINKI
jgi:hypothetical protein